MYRNTGCGCLIIVGLVTLGIFVISRPADPPRPRERDTVQLDVEERDTQPQDSPEPEELPFEEPAKEGPEEGPDDEREPDLTPDGVRLRNAWLSYRDEPLSESRALLEQRKLELRGTRHRQRRAELESQIERLYWRVAELSAPIGKPLITSATARVGDIGVFEESLEVFQVVDAGRMLVRGRSDRWIMVRGVNASRLTDGNWWRPSGIYEIVGTEQYVTAIGGTNTVLSMRPFSIQSVPAPDPPVTDSDRRRQLASDHFSRDEHDLRSWTDSTGQFTVEARFWSRRSDVIRLKRPDETEIDVPLDRLSDGCREYLREIGARK